MKNIFRNRKAKKPKTAKIGLRDVSQYEIGQIISIDGIGSNFKVVWIDKENNKIEVKLNV